MTTKQTKVYTFEAFAALVHDELHLPSSLSIATDSTLVDDLGFDSLRMVELWAVLEERLGVVARVDFVDDWQTLTVEQLYSYYLAHADLLSPTAERQAPLDQHENRA